MKKLIIFALIALLLTSCAAETPAATPDPSGALSQQYKLGHDYASLVALLPYLHRPMSRADVEALLGKAYCKTPTTCFYPTDKVMLYCPDAYTLENGICKTANEELKAFELTWELIVYFSANDAGLASPDDTLIGVEFMPMQ